MLIDKLFFIEIFVLFHEREEQKKEGSETYPNINTSSIFVVFPVLLLVHDC